MRESECPEAVPEAVSLEQLLREVSVNLTSLYYYVSEPDGLVCIEGVSVFPGFVGVGKASEDDPEADSEFFDKAPLMSALMISLARSSASR